MLWLLLIGDYDQMRTGRTHGGEYACFGCGNTSHFMEGFSVCLSKMKRYKENCKGKWQGGKFSDNKGKGNNSEAGCKNIGKRENRNDNVRFGEVENDSPRNAAYSLDESAGVSDASGVNFTDREVLIPNEMLCPNEWKVKPWGSKVGDFPRIIDTGFNGGGGVV